MKRSTERIITTHTGSLARPVDLLDLMKAKVTGQAYDVAGYTSRVHDAVAEIVRFQIDNGIDIVTDGEQSKPGFFAYITERLSGFEPRPGGRRALFEAELAAFPEYYEQYFKQAMTGGAIAPIVPLVCTGPVGYRGTEALQQDIANLTAAVGASNADVFMPAVSPNGVGRNEYYASDEAYRFAVADALHTEYQAIVDAGFVLQVDDPFFIDIFGDDTLSPGEKHARGELYVAAVNRALAGIPADRVRFHTCYGINEGPRIFDAALADFVDIMLHVNAGAYSFEAANPRHEHEYHVWESVKLPADKILIPGVITHASNIVEHPEYIAERIVRYARLVGRENVIPGSDCGFSSQATYNPEVHPTVVAAKFRALAEGAQIATKQLWG